MRHGTLGLAALLLAAVALVATGMGAPTRAAPDPTDAPATAPKPPGTATMPPANSPTPPATATMPPLPPTAAIGAIPAACRGDNPYFAVAVPGRAYAPDRASAPAIVAFVDTADDNPAEHVVLGTHGEIGATYGLAYDWRRGHLYVGAYHRRGSPLGPGGPGQIYRIVLGLGTVEPWAVLPTGPDRHGGDGDIEAASWVGRSGLGDLEMDDTGTVLFAMNLHERRIHRLSVPDGAYLGSFPYGAAEEPWAERAAPFGLGFHDGWLYHGVVDTGASGSSGTSPVAYLYRSKPDGTAMSLVLSADLGYRAQPAWSAWSDDVASDGAPQPMFADIEFRPNGDPVIGLRDRSADMAPVVASGDVLPTTGGPNRQVVVAPEHYPDRWQYDESLWGALATMPGFDLIIASAGAPVRTGSAGAVWYYNETGGEVTSETVASGGAGDDVSFGGLGDIELLCGPPGAPTLVPTSTPVPAPMPAYVPVALREACPQLALDVALVIDLSSSMREDTPDGRTKVAAALEAASTFVGLLDLRPDDAATTDRAAIVGFNSAAWTEQGLTGNAVSLSEAIDRLASRTAPYTRLDLAIREGATAATGAPRSDAVTVLVLLTDGRPSQVPPADDGRVETTVLRAAQAAKDAGVHLYSVGLGAPDDVDGPLLASMASDPTGYLYAPDAATLREVYVALARDVRCPPGRHDWSKPWP